MLWLTKVNTRAKRLRGVMVNVQKDGKGRREHAIVSNSQRQALFEHQKGQQVQRRLYRDLQRIEEHYQADLNSRTDGGRLKLADFENDPGERSP